MTDFKNENNVEIGHYGQTLDSVCFSVYIINKLF